MNFVIEQMQPKMLRTYLTILAEQNPDWENQPESFEAIEIAKIGTLLGREANSSLKPLEKIEDMTVDIFLDLKEKGYPLKEVAAASGMTKKQFYRWRAASGLLRKKAKSGRR